MRGILGQPGVDIESLQFTRLVKNLAIGIFPEPSSEDRTIAERGFLFSRRSAI